jgi:hypothetical protein
MPADIKADCEKVLTALNGAVRLSRQEIYTLFGRHRTQAEVEAMGQALETGGSIRRRMIRPPGGNERRPTELWEITSQSHGLTNGSAAATEDGPPVGEGWLPKAKTLRLAQRGVVPAVAARAGRLARKRDRAVRGSVKAGPPKVSDEQRGATKLIGQAYRGYREQGIIEEQGDWIRLVKNPPRRPPHHWYEALLHFLADGHPTLDGKWRRKPKQTLAGVTQDALGRELKPNERVHRFPGCAGSWNGDDILLYDLDTRTITTLAEIREGRGDEV